MDSRLGFEALAGYEVKTRKARLEPRVQEVSRLIQVVSIIDDWVTTEGIREPIRSFTSQIISIARIWPILHARYVAVLNRVIVDIVEPGPEASFVADAGVPIIMPNLPAMHIISLVYLVRDPSVKSLEEIW